MKTQFMFLVLAVASSWVQAGERSMTSLEDRPDVPVVEYRYGMSLDIAKVLRMTSTAQACNVGQTTMTYQDHAGDLHALAYQAIGSDCHEN